jgi:uncharacterized BrkB/YihY/UPF0761 family membrane protein
MSNMEKLLAVISVGQRAYGRWLFQRLLPGIIVIVGLTVVISIMVSAMIVGGLYIAYGALLQYGFEPQMAMLAICISAVITIILLVVIAMLGLRHLRQTPKIMNTQTPLSSFIEGFIAG